MSKNGIPREPSPFWALEFRNFAFAAFRRTSTTMPVPTTVYHEKNIWVAAGDGDIDRVRVRRRFILECLVLIAVLRFSAGADRSALFVRLTELHGHENELCLYSDIAQRA